MAIDAALIAYIYIYIFSAHRLRLWQAFSGRAPMSSMQQQHTHMHAHANASFYWSTSMQAIVYSIGVH